ncbi:hypothetical protein JRO89_XS10G0190800 [Xanthoceras sorbifolium]|uniref:Gag/pol protein n=1 Tax=Xanthoceras sorbifolium TaxID=99658 RepID=A0ABQ8HJF9_9ROSI|nr:hypothetical protein JRO89_XS10G0190800 [Xanthoceras sorbifolium]
MRHISYASAVDSLMYDMLCIRPDICFAMVVASRYQSNPRLDHWVAVKTILKYLRRMRRYMLVYSAQYLILLGYTNSDFQSDKDSRKSTSRLTFTLCGGAIVWRSIKQSCIADSTMEAEYVAACEAAKEAAWFRKFLNDLEVVPDLDTPMTCYCDNSGTVANRKELRNHKRGKHIKRKYHKRDIVQRGDVIVTKITSKDNLADPFTKTLTAKCLKVRSWLLIYHELEIIEQEIRQVENEKLQREETLGAFWEHMPAIDPIIIRDHMLFLHNEICALKNRKRALLEEQQALIVQAVTGGY